jgi:hypothetical protein
MSRPAADIEEHELPSVEAMLAGTLALMTGYSQALQAELDPRGRVALGDKIAANLALLLEHPLLSCGFREVLNGLRQRWLAMGECTRAAAGGADGGCRCAARARAAATPWLLPAPSRLQ